MTHTRKEVLPTKHRQRIIIRKIKNGVALHFNGQKVSIDLKEKREDDSSLIAFAQNAFICGNENFDFYLNFYSDYSSDRIRQSIQIAPGSKEQLKASIKNHSNIILVIDASPIHVLFYEFPAVKGISMKFVQGFKSNYKFINFNMFDPVSDLMNIVGKRLNDEDKIISYMPLKQYE